MFSGAQSNSCHGLAAEVSTGTYWLAYLLTYLLQHLSFGQRFGGLFTYLMPVSRQIRYTPLGLGFGVIQFCDFEIAVPSSRSKPQQSSRNLKYLV